MSPPYSLLICSLGNPAPHQSTLHSAGHILLSQLRLALALPPLQKSKAHGNGLLSASSEYTLWQSTSQMNISGAGVARSWRTFVSENSPGASSLMQGLESRLVILHDELEADLGEVRVRKGEKGSLKGHNGLKSVREAMASYAGGRAEWWRVGVGIGRPVSREQSAVSKWVLKNMTAPERRGVEGTVDAVLEILRGLKEGILVV